MRSDLLDMIDDSCRYNRNPYSIPLVVGRIKVIRTQLNSQTRKLLCDLQGVEYSSSSLFADIEPVLLPNILAIIGANHDQSELYNALILTAPDLMSYIDRKAMLKDVMTKNVARINALSEEMFLSIPRTLK